MPRYIDVDTVAFDITGLARISPYNFRGIAFYFLEQLDSMPSADVRENVRGKWIPVTNGRGGSECNQCHAYAPTYKNGTEYNSNFCPNCGADMRQRSKNE